MTPGRCKESRPLSSAPEEWVAQTSPSREKVGGPDVFLEFRNALMANAGGILPKARKRDEATSVFRLICKPTMGRRHLPLAHKS